MATYYNAVFIVITKDASRIPRKAGGKTCLLEEMPYGDAKDFVIFVDRFNARMKHLKKENTKQVDGNSELDMVSYDIGMTLGMIEELELLGERMQDEAENIPHVFKEIDELTTKFQNELAKLEKKKK